MDILLIAGLWLDASAWDDVAAQLEARGHRAVPVTLPGQGDGNTSATLADQVAAVVAAADAAAGRPMLVGIPLPAAWRGSPPTPAPARSARSS
jgi:pimeloyl-ACP methyl ester carboxylesterase